MPAAYIKTLQKELAPLAPEAPQPAADLETRLVRWLERQPEISRLRAYAMSELEHALGTQGKYLSPILLRLGWERRRRWSGKTQYLRYWVPPGA